MKRLPMWKMRCMLCPHKLIKVMYAPTIMMQQLKRFANTEIREAAKREAFRWGLKEDAVVNCNEFISPLADKLDDLVTEAISETLRVNAAVLVHEAMKKEKELDGELLKFRPEEQHE